MLQILGCYDTTLETMMAPHHSEKKYVDIMLILFVEVEFGVGFAIHYRNAQLCRVSTAHDEAQKNTRQSLYRVLHSANGARRT